MSKLTDKQARMLHDLVHVGGEPLVMMSDDPQGMVHDLVCIIHHVLAQHEALISGPDEEPTPIERE